MRAHSPLWNRWRHRSVCVPRPATLRMSVTVAVLVLVALLGAAHPLAAQSTPDPCPYGKVVTSADATVERGHTTLQPGPLFAGSGSFEEKPVDTACDPGQEYGPFPVDAGGTLVARLSGDPPAPNQWSLFNNGVGVTIVYEPLLGAGHYGPGREIVRFAIPAEQSSAEQGGSWPGPGRIRAYIGAPWGTGPLTSSCFGQSYTLDVEVTEVTGAIPAQPGLSIQDGDRVVTGGASGWALLAGSTTGLGPNTEVTFQRMGGTSAHPPTIPPYVDALAKQVAELSAAGYPMPKGYHGDPAAFWAAYDYPTLQEAYARLNSQPNPCEAALELKLFLESHQGQWTAGKTADVGIEVLSIWLLPNKYNALEGLLKWALRPVPVLGIIANLDNARLSYELVTRELAIEASATRAGRALNTFVETRGLSSYQITERELALSSDITLRHDAISRARADMEETIGRYEEVVVNLGCTRSMLGLGKDEDGNDTLSPELRAEVLERCPAAIRNYWAARTQAEQTYVATVQPYLAQILAAELDLADLETYRKPLLDGDCEELKQQQPEPAPPGMWDAICDNSTWKLTLGKGLLHVYKEKYPWIEPAIYIVNDWLLAPDGTEFVAENLGDTAIVRVLDGALNLTGPDGEILRVVAGEQATLPNGEIMPLEPLPVRRIAGIPLHEIPLDSDVPAPYGALDLRAPDGTLPAGWLWQEPNNNLDGPGNATLEIVDETTLRITVPHDNDLWASRADAPRLLHKVSGDFDLEADILLETAATHLAYSEFLLYTPDLPIGYLQQQMNLDAPSANYLILGGGWARAEGLNKLRVLNRPLREGIDAPATPVRVKFIRRGDLFKTYWSLDDGATWTISSRSLLELPETIWVGWSFKRVAADWLANEAAVTTLANVRLTSASLGTLPDAGWDLAWPATTIDLGAELFMLEDGPEGNYLQVYSPWAIPGDFDLIVNFSAPALTPQLGQERTIHIAVTSPDDLNHAYLRQVVATDRQRIDADMSIDNSWYRYHYTPTDATADASGRVRLVREADIVSGYTWQDEDWVLLADWQDDFSGPLFLNFQFNWVSPIDDPQAAWISVERLETDAGVLIETVALTETAALPLTESTPTPEPEPTPLLTGAQRLEADSIFDDFSSDALGWSVRDNESAATGYSDEAYTIWVKQPTYWVMSKIPGDFVAQSVEFDAWIVPGAKSGMYGVICHYRNGDTYDFVSVNPETLGIAAGRLTNGQWEFLSSGPGDVIEQPAKHLAREVNATNHIRIDCLDERLAVMVNGEPEGSWPLDPPADGGNAALFAYGFQGMAADGYTVAFDNVAAWRGDAPAAASNAPPVVCEIEVDATLAPQWDTALLGCPTDAALQTWAVVQAFERGLMVARGDIPLIYAFYDAHGWDLWVDEWYRGAALPSRGEPPPGLQAPVLGFGYLWANDDQIFENLGWARWEESGMCATIQTFEHGIVIARRDVATCDDRSNPAASGWFGSVEAHFDGTWR